MATLVAAQAAAKQAAIDKDAALDALVASMRSDLNYAENQVGGDDAKLAQLGREGKAAASVPAPPRPAAHARRPNPLSDPTEFCLPA